MTLCSSSTSTRLLRWEACLPCSLPYEIRAPSVPCVGLLLLELNCQSIMPIVWEGITQLTVQGPSGGRNCAGPLSVCPFSYYVIAQSYTHSHVSSVVLMSKWFDSGTCSATTSCSLSCIIKIY